MLDCTLIYLIIYKYNILKTLLNKNNQIIR